MPETSAERTEREAAEKARRKNQQAAIVAALQEILEGDEQLLAFSRGRIAGGWRGRLAVGPEAFFAPDVNIGLTERRLVLQHVLAESGKPSQILPHIFNLSDLNAISFGDIETFGAEPAGRLTIRFKDEQHFRLRLTGKDACEDAQSIVEVFRSLTSVLKKETMSPTQRVCANCKNILDQLTKFCPYCGARQPEEAKAVVPEPAPAETYSEIPETPPVGAFVPDIPTPPAPPETPLPPIPPAAPEFGIPERPDFGIPVTPVPPAPSEAPPAPEASAAPAPPVDAVPPTPVAEFVLPDIPTVPQPPAEPMIGFVAAPAVTEEIAAVPVAPEVPATPAPPMEAELPVAILPEPAPAVEASAVESAPVISVPPPVPTFPSWEAYADSQARSEQEAP